jgi:hypothetical protein
MCVTWNYFRVGSSVLFMLIFGCVHKQTGGLSIEILRTSISCLKRHYSIQVLVGMNNEEAILPIEVLRPLIHHPANHNPITIRHRLRKKCTIR